MAYCSQLICALLVASVVSESFASDDPIAETQYGQVRGKVVTLLDPEAPPSYAFLNLPYAAPPVGERRFEDPQPPEAWEGVRDATQYGPACPQPLALLSVTFSQDLNLPMPPLEDTSEDCLHLNVYTPALTGSRPVMVFIHGGGLIVGWASTYDMRAYASLHDVVGVIIQYRLGPLGFISTGPEGPIRGNQGFKDQIAALQWVRDNIAQFGGDPDRVTIFGESSGSLCICMHLLSPASDGLFQSAIMHSGSIQGSAAFAPPVQPAKEIAKLATTLGCPTEPVDSMISCLREQPAQSLVNPSGNGMLDQEFFTSWSPGLEEGYFSAVPDQLIQEGSFKKDVNLMIGFTQVEGFMMGKTFFAPGFDQPGMDLPKFKAIAGEMLSIMFPPATYDLEPLVDLVADKYTRGRFEDWELSLGIAEMVGDFLITACTVKTARDVARIGKQPVYMFEVAIRHPLSIRPHYIIADHVDDIFFTMGYSLFGEFDGKPLDVPHDEAAEKAQDLMMQYWANFAKTGNPSGPGVPDWPLHKDDASYMVISDSPEIRHNYEPDRMKLWLETIPSLAEGSSKGQQAVKEEL